MTPEGGWPVALLRAGSDASLLSLLGALVFRTAIGQAGLTTARWSAAAALLAIPAWACVEAVNLGGSPAAIPDVLAITQFGHLAAGSWLCALAALIVAGPGWRSPAALSAAAVSVVLQAGHSHAAAMDPGFGLLHISITLHLLAAGSWLGGLLPLARLVSRSPLPPLLAALRRYSPLGLGCVLVLAATATVQATTLVGGSDAWIATGYGRVAIAKLLLFAALIALAAVHRLVLTPALTRGSPGRARRRLAFSLAAETLAGLMVVAAAALLSSLEPGMDMPMSDPAG